MNVLVSPGSVTWSNRPFCSAPTASKASSSDIRRIFMVTCLRRRRGPSTPAFAARRHRRARRAWPRRRRVGPRLTLPAPHRRQRTRRRCHLPAACGGDRARSMPSLCRTRAASARADVQQRYNVERVSDVLQQQRIIILRWSWRSLAAPVTAAPPPPVIVHAPRHGRAAPRPRGPTQRALQQHHLGSSSGVVPLIYSESACERRQGSSGGPTAYALCYHLLRASTCRTSQARQPFLVVSARRFCTMLARPTMVPHARDLRVERNQVFGPGILEFGAIFLQIRPQHARAPRRRQHSDPVSSDASPMTTPSPRRATIRALDVDPCRPRRRRRAPRGRTGSRSTTLPGRTGSRPPASFSRGHRCDRQLLRIPPSAGQLAACAEPHCFAGVEVGESRSSPPGMIDRCAWSSSSPARGAAPCLQEATLYLLAASRQSALHDSGAREGERTGPALHTRLGALSAARTSSPLHTLAASACIIAGEDAYTLDQVEQLDRALGA